MAKSKTPTIKINLTAITIAVLFIACLAQLGIIFIISNQKKTANLHQTSSPLPSLDYKNNIIHIASEKINYTEKSNDFFLNIAKELLTKADGKTPENLRLIRANYYSAFVSFDGGYAMFNHGALEYPGSDLFPKGLIARGTTIDNIAAINNNHAHADAIRALRGKKEDLIYSAICRYKTTDEKASCRQSSQFQLDFQTIKSKNSEFIIGITSGHPSSTEADNLMLAFNYRTGQYDNFADASKKAPLSAFLRSISAPKAAFESIFPDGNSSCTNNNSPECIFFKNLKASDYIKNSN